MLVLAVEETTDIRILAEQFIQHCHASGIAPSTMPARINRLNHFVAFCEKHGADVTAVSNVFMDYYYLEYAKGDKKPRKTSSVNASRRVLKVFISWIEAYKEMNVRVKTEAIKYAREPKKLPKALDRTTILTAIESVADPYDALMIETEWRAGLRISELVSIREKDIFMDELFIHGKGAVERIVYVTDSLAASLNNLKIGDPERLIFRNLRKDGEPIGVKAARLHIQRTFQSIGVEMHPHQLRHSFAVELLLKGCDIVTIQRLMGHEDITTTQVYLRLFDDQVKKQYKKFMV